MLHKSEACMSLVCLLAWLVQGSSGTVKRFCPDCQASRRSPVSYGSVYTSWYAARPVLISQLVTVQEQKMGARISAAKG